MELIVSEVQYEAGVRFLEELSRLVWDQRPFTRLPSTQLACLFQRVQLCQACGSLKGNITLGPRFYAPCGEMLGKAGKHLL